MNAEKYYQYEKLGEPEHFDEGPNNKKECCETKSCRECVALADGFGYVCPTSIIDMYIMPASIKLFDRSWKAAKKKFDSLTQKHKDRFIDNKIDDYYKCLSLKRTKPVQLEIQFD